LITISNIYYRLVDIKEEDKLLRKKIRLYNNAFIAGLISLVIAYLAYIEKILPAFFFVFVLHYYLHLSE
jgi:hypothetical protein